MTTHNKSLTDESGDVRSPDKEDVASMNRMSALTAPLQTKLKLRGRPVAETTKERITIRLSPDAVHQFRITGPGWQTRIDAALTDWLKEHSANDVGRAAKVDTMQKILKLSIADFLPMKGVVVLIAGDNTPYRISERLHATLKAEAEKRGQTISTLLKQLRDEINSL